jgi:hypothetical protein
MAKKPTNPEEISYAEYEEMPNSGAEKKHETQREIVDRVSEGPKKATLDVLSRAVPVASKLTKEDVARKDEFK